MAIKYNRDGSSQATCTDCNRILTSCCCHLDEGAPREDWIVQARRPDGSVAKADCYSNEQTARFQADLLRDRIEHAGRLSALGDDFLAVIVRPDGEEECLVPADLRGDDLLEPRCLGCEVEVQPGNGYCTACEADRAASP